MPLRVRETSICAQVEQDSHPFLVTLPRRPLQGRVAAIVIGGSVVKVRTCTRQQTHDIEVSIPDGAPFPSTAFKSARARQRICTMAPSGCCTAVWRGVLSKEALRSTEKHVHGAFGSAPALMRRSAAPGSLCRAAMKIGGLRTAVGDRSSGLAGSWSNRAPRRRRQ